MNIALIGYRGSGKTTIGRLLAEALGFAFVDTDARIVERAGKSIRQIFTEAGEPGFRDLESAVIADLGRADRLVLALGGGAVLRSQNIAALKPGATVVYLTADAETLYRRIMADPSTTATRPNLTAAGGMEEVRHLLAVRAPLYLAAADVTLDVSSLSPAEAAAELLRQVSARDPHLQPRKVSP